MDVTDEVYRGLDCLRLSNDVLSVWLTTSVGLRLIGLRYADRRDLLADLPGSSLELASGEEYLLRGGHRLWVAPERPETTYLPDNEPVESVLEEDSVEQFQPVDSQTGIQKSWRIRLASQGARVDILHRLANLGDDPISLAPWAITMLRPGGLGLLPLPSSPVDEHGLQPNRHLVLWPYTPVDSPHILWRDDAIFVRADMRDKALKLGIPNPEGWLAYQLDDLLFVKGAPFEPTAHYLDRGASSQVFLSPETIELETLGPEAMLAPGESVVHQEAWELYAEGSWKEEILALYETYPTSADQSH